MNQEREWTGRELDDGKRAFEAEAAEKLSRRESMPTATRIARDVSQLDPIWAQTLAWGYMRMLPIVEHMAKEECWDWDPCSPEFDLPITGPDARSLKCPPCRARELLAKINPP